MNFNLFFRNASLCSVVFIWFSCSSMQVKTDADYINHDGRLYNIPFINSEETSKLDFGLSKNQVKDILGTPLYVASGVGETKTIIWIYEVRTILVKGNIVEKNNNYSYYNNQFVHDMDEMSLMDTTNTTSKGIIESRYVPNKNNSNILHSEVFHILGLEFIDDKLTNWGPLNKDDTNHDKPKETKYKRAFGSVKIEKYFE